MVPNVKNQPIFKRICMESLKHNCSNILPTIRTNEHADFWQGYIFSLDFLDDLNKSHKITNFNFYYVTLYHFI